MDNLNDTPSVILNDNSVIFLNNTIGVLLNVSEESGSRSFATAQDDSTGAQGDITRNLIPDRLCRGEAML